MSDNFLSAGCAEKVITPQKPGAQLAGYFKAREARGVRDDIFARAFVIGNDTDTLVIVSCDLIAVPSEISEPVKQQIMRKHNILPRQICICATHTHTAPEIRSANTPNKYDPAYNECLIALITDVVSEALLNRFEARIHYGATIVEGLSFNRLYRLQNGAEIFGRSKSLENDIIGLAGPLDTSLQTLCLKDSSGGFRAILVNFACHPDTHPDDRGIMQENLISADWPGEMVRAMRAIYGKETCIFFLQGCCGDINHVNYGCSWQKLSGEHKTMQLGRGIAGAAVLAAERAEPVASVQIKSVLKTLAVPYFTRDKAIMEYLEMLRAGAKSNQRDKYIMQAIENWPHDGQNADVPIQAMRIGDIAVVGLPGEIFNAIGLEIKHYSPTQKTMVVELANARVTPYVPTTDQAERGGYGAMPILTRYLCADAGRRMSECAIAMLHELWRR